MQSLPDAASRSTEKVVAFVVARLSSSRFPAKHLRTIGEKRIIDWTLEGLRQSEEIDEIVIATVAEPENEPLREIAARQQTGFFWYEGEVDHVTTRLRRAAEVFDADICLLISGDCPLIHGPLIDSLVRALKADPEGDYLAVPPDSVGRPPMTEGLGAYRLRAWQRGDDLSERPELKEHQFPIVKQRPDLFSATVHPGLPSEFYGARHRLSIDTRADLEFMNRVHDELRAAGRPFRLPEVLRLIEDQSHLREINVHVHQRGLVEEIRRALFIVDAGGSFGYGHLMRSMELAHQMVEHRGHPVCFLVDDARAMEQLRRESIPAFWGAYGREPRPLPEGERPFSGPYGRYDYLVLDLHAGRTLESGWRGRDFSGSSVLALDTLAPWSDEADLRVIPGLTCPEEFRNPSPGEAPELLEGGRYVILRQEIRSAARTATPKELDLLAYLHREEQREAVRDIAASEGVRVHVVEGFEPGFATLLAKSRCYLGNFGQGFYEALALGAYPINWPLTSQHESDSLLFYRRLGLPPAIVREPGDLKELLPALLREKAWEGLSLKDGTAAIIDRLVGLRNRRKGTQP